MTEILIDEVTSGDTLPGVGYFDEIMASNQIRLEAEFDKNRIKATEYSKVYLGAMESALAQSIAFALGRQEASAKADLLKSTNLKMIVEIDNEKLKGELVSKQIEKIDAEIIHLNATTLRVESEVNINEKQLLLMDKDLELKSQQIIKSTADIELVHKQVQKVDQEILLMEQQVEKLKADVLLANKELELKDKEIVLMGKQVDKMTQEILLMKEQIVMMQAQIAVEQEKLDIMKQEAEKISHEIFLLEQQGFAEMSKTQDYLGVVDSAGNVTKHFVAGSVKKEQEKIDAETALINQNKELSILQEDVVKSEVIKVSHETFLIDQHVSTESAKTQDKISLVDRDGNVNIVDVGGSTLKEQRKTDAEINLIAKNAVLAELQEEVVKEETTKLAHESWLSAQQGYTEASKTQDSLRVTDPVTGAYVKDIPVAGTIKRANDKLESENELIRQNKEVALLQEDVVKNEAIKVATEKELIVSKAFTEIANTQDNWIFEDKPYNVQGNSVIAKQKLKLDKEAEILSAKYWTEAAQTLDAIPNATGGKHYVNANSIIGKQKLVYAKQAAGFDRKFEQEMAKIMTDSYSVRRSTEETATSPNSMTNKNIDKVIDKAAKGIGINNIDTNTPSNN